MAVELPPTLSLVSATGCVCHSRVCTCSAVHAELTPEVGPDAVQFRVAKTATPYPDTPVPEAGQLKIGRQTQYSQLAGALAGRARDGAARLSVLGSGAGQILLLVKALALASKFVVRDVRTERGARLNRAPLHDAFLPSSAAAGRRHHGLLRLYRHR